MIVFSSWSILLFFFFWRRPKLHFCNFVTFCRNEAVVISGRKLAQQIKQEVRQEVEEWVASGNKRPHLSVILVGDNPASHSYVLNKTRAAAEVGKCRVRVLLSLSKSVWRRSGHTRACFLSLSRAPSDGPHRNPSPFGRVSQKDQEFKVSLGHGAGLRSSWTT